jgi:hypothetical protein
MGEMTIFGGVYFILNRLNIESQSQIIVFEIISMINVFRVTRQFWIVYYSTVIYGSHPPCFPSSGEGGIAFPGVFRRFYRLKTPVADGPSPKFGGVPQGHATRGLGWGLKSESLKP